MEQSMIILAINGVLILTISLISGGWFANAITTKGNEVAWRVVHSGGSMGGIMLIAFASLLPLVVLPQWAETLFLCSITLSAWLFIIAMIAAAITGQRGLKPGGSLINRGVYYFYIIASILSLVGCGLLLKGLYSAL